MVRKRKGSCFLRYRHHLKSSFDYTFIFMCFFFLVIITEKKKKTVNLCESGIKQVVGLKELKNIYFLYWGIGNRTPHLKHVHTYCRNITINYFILFLFLLLLFHTQLPKPSFLSSGPNQIKSLSLFLLFHVPRPLNFAKMLGLFSLSTIPNNNAIKPVNSQSLVSTSATATKPRSPILFSLLLFSL